MAKKTISYRYALPFLMACVMVGVLPGMRDGELAAQDQPRTSTTCLGCHEDQKATLAGTGHALSDAEDDSAARIACTDCHGVNPRHWEEGPAENPMIDPRELGAVALAKLCGSCHQNAHQQNMLEKNVHATHEINCTGCHSVHRTKHAALLKKAESALCFDCHGVVEGEFARPYRHPVADGVVKCSECHQTLDETRRDLSQRVGSACVTCHAELDGPFPYEHQAMLDYSPEEGGCMSCHEPHGSSLPRMLKQRYEAPHFQLCTQCHLVPRHNANTMHGTAWAGVPCNDCHTDIHGSYDNRFFLSESLRSQGCLNPACHGR